MFPNLIIHTVNSSFCLLSFFLPHLWMFLFDNLQRAHLLLAVSGCTPAYYSPRVFNLKLPFCTLARQTPQLTFFWGVLPFVFLNQQLYCISLYRGPAKCQVPCQTLSNSTLQARKLDQGHTSKLEQVNVE